MSSAGCWRRCGRSGVAPPVLSASEIAAVGDLELAARMVIDGLHAGGHRSARRGAGAEFQIHRPYRAGDDLKHLDWKLLARTDRLYSRQYRETTSMPVMIVLDTSASMAFPEHADGDDASDGHDASAGDVVMSKLRYAAVLAASLAYVVITQGDAAGLMTMRDGRLDYLPTRGGRAHLRSLIGRLERLTAGGAWSADRAITRGAELLRRRGVIVVISDFYDDEDATRAAMRRVARAGHDVVMMQLLADAELALAYRGDLEIEDMETGERRLVDAGAVAPAYAAAVDAFLTRCRTAAARDGVDYVLTAASTPPGAALRAFLLRRGAGAVGGAVATGAR
ncbi:DUF58 domain-containing protein [soil metagenome]